MAEEVLVITKKVTKEELKKIAEHFKGYIKVVVDIEKEILCGGADRHVDEKKVLLEMGSEQKDLWGGGFDTKTKELDFNSVINLRPNQDNPSRDILDKGIRDNFAKIVQEILQ